LVKVKFACQSNKDAARVIILNNLSFQPITCIPADSTLGKLSYSSLKRSSNQTRLGISTLPYFAAAQIFHIACCCDIEPEHLASPVNH
jgi:hypothetical protein